MDKRGDEFFFVSECVHGGLPLALRLSEGLSITTLAVRGCRE
jgi:hypothetical protein